MSWIEDAVLYQIYPRSFADSDGDGHGDLRGVIERLDYLEWLGVDGIWLCPVFPSPNHDWGYDVSDYKGIHEDFGTLEDSDRLVAEAAGRGIRVIYDLVPNHTSDAHPWFRDALTSRTARHRDWYVWADGKEDGPPNNWISVAGGPAWTLHEPSGQYYLHNFLPGQPDLNWWNEDVRAAFEDILGFWFDRGIAGFRIDVCHALIKDRYLRDNPPSRGEDHPLIRRHGQRQQYNMNRPETHEILKRWRKLADAAGDKVLIGETWVLELERMISYYGTGADELHLALNFPFLFSDFDAGSLADIVEDVERLMPRDAWPVWTGSNHDVSRFPTRWCGGDEARIRCALTMLMTLRGTPILYYGDEIGQRDARVPEDKIRDEMGRPGSAHYPGRDAGRAPMQWSAVEGAGFTAPGVKPWLPFGDFESVNVERQANDGASVLNLCRDLIRLRKERSDLARGAYRRVPSPSGTWAYRRGDSIVVALNLSSAETDLEVGTGEVLAGTDRTREGERVSHRLPLRPFEAVVIEGPPQ